MTGEYIDAVAKAIQNYNALIQCAQCISAGHKPPDMTQFKMWEKLTEEERDYIRPIAEIAIKATTMFPNEMDTSELLKHDPLLKGKE